MHVSLTGITYRPDILQALPAGAPHEAYDEETARRALERALRIVQYARRKIRERAGAVLQEIVKRIVQKSQDACSNTL